MIKETEYTCSTSRGQPNEIQKHEFSSWFFWIFYWRLSMDTKWNRGFAAQQRPKALALAAERSGRSSSCLPPPPIVLHPVTDAEQQRLTWGNFKRTRP